MEHPVAGKMKITGNQVKLSETPVQFKTPAPLLGQHTDEILENMLHMDRGRIQELKEKNVF